MRERIRRLAGHLAAAPLLLALFSPLHASAQADSLTVVRDPQTGQLRAPSAAEAQGLRAPAPAASRTRPGNLGMLTGRPNPQPVKRADGSVMLELTEDTMSHSVVTRGADGKLRRHCVNSQEMAERLASGAVVSFAKNMMERAHEAQ